MKGIFRIGIALFVGSIIVGGAYFLRHDAVAESSVEDDAATLVAAKMLREYQAIEDRDRDGKPDWKETMLGTNPNIPNLRPTSTTVYEAKTETDRFMVDFFANYLEKRGRGPLDTGDISSFAAASANKIQTLSTDTIFTLEDIQTTASDDSESFKTYGNTVGEILLRNGKNTARVENEAVILKRAVETENKEELAKLRPIREGYAATIKELQKIPVPKSLAKDHVALLTALQAIHDDIKAMERVFEDPIVTFVRVKRYQDDASGLMYALEGIGSKLKMKTQFEKTESGAFLLSLLR